MLSEHFREGITLIELNYDCAFSDPVLSLWMECFLKSEEFEFLKAVKRWIFYHRDRPTPADIRKSIFSESRQKSSREWRWIATEESGGERLIKFVEISSRGAFAVEWLVQCWLDGSLCINQEQDVMKAFRRVYVNSRAYAVGGSFLAPAIEDLHILKNAAIYIGYFNNLLQLLKRLRVCTGAEMSPDFTHICRLVPDIVLKEWRQMLYLLPPASQALFSQHFWPAFCGVDRKVVHLATTSEPMFKLARDKISAIESAYRRKYPDVKVKLCVARTASEILNNLPSLQSIESDDCF